MIEFKPPIYQLVYPADGFCYAVDDKEESNMGEWGYFEHDDRIAKSYIFGGKKIITTNNPAITDVPRLPEPDGQEDIKTLAEKYAQDQCKDVIDGMRYDKSDIIHLIREVFKDGYAAKGKGMYSEDDLMVFYKHVKTHTVEEAMNHMKALKFPKPIAVELDGQVLGTPSDWLNDRQSFVPKFVNNTVIVKRLIFNEKDLQQVS